MEEKTEIKDGFWLFRNRKIFVISLVVFVLVLTLGITASCFAAILTSDRMYDGVYIGELSVASLTKEEAHSLVSDYYQIKYEQEISLVCGEEERVLPISSLDAVLDTDAMINEA